MQLERRDRQQPPRQWEIERRTRYRLSVGEFKFERIQTPRNFLGLGMSKTFYATIAIDDNAKGPKLWGPGVSACFLLTPSEVESARLKVHVYTKRLLPGPKRWKSFGAFEQPVKSVLKDLMKDLKEGDEGAATQTYQYRTLDGMMIHYTISYRQEDRILATIRSF